MVCSSRARWVEHRCRNTHPHTICQTYNHLLLWNHKLRQISAPAEPFPSFSFTSACVQPCIATSCCVFMLPHTHAQTCICVWLFVYLCMVSILWGFFIVMWLHVFVMYSKYPLIPSHAFSNTLLLLLPLLSCQSLRVQKLECHRPPCSDPVATWM